MKGVNIGFTGGAAASRLALRLAGRQSRLCLRAGKCTAA
ncbi:hypothetical protein CSC17_4953 [Klebsiella oxytoca]|nr:hypothetical protein CSC17_4953 [Klebsiella oxytoca]